MAIDISVIVPVYNVGPYLEQCVNSILNQMFRNIEIILVDDGSEDDSPEICDALQMRYSQIKVIHQANAGAGMARNSGLKAACGQYVTFSDSDDHIADRDLLKTLYETAVSTGADCVASGSTMLYPGGKTRPIPITEKRQIFAGGQVEEFLLRTLSAPPESSVDSVYGQSVCAKLFRRQIIEENNLSFVSEREYLSEDTLFNLDFLKHAARAAVVPDVSYYYNCTHQGSLSKAYRSDRFPMELILTHAIEKRLAEFLPPDKYRLYLQRFLIMRTAFDLTQEVLYHDHVDRTHPMRERIGAVLAHPELHGCLKSYPWHRLPLLRMILAGTMRFQLTELLIFLIRVQQRVMLSCQNI